MAQDTLESPLPSYMSCVSNRIWVWHYGQKPTCRYACNRPGHFFFLFFFFTSHHPQALGLFNNRKSDEQMKKKKEQIEEKKI